MNDNANLSKLLTDEIPDFSSCAEKSSFSSGERCSLRNYKFRRHFQDINISLNESNGRMAVKGNWGMFWNGHNIFFPFADFRDALEFVSHSIKIDLFSAFVNEFDHSAVVSTAFNPKLLFQNHFHLTGHLIKEQKHGKYFVKEQVQIVKMYDVGRRIKQIYSREMRENIFASARINTTGNLIRVEKKIFNPKNYFKRSIFAEDLLKPEFISECDNDLLETYNNITKLGRIQMPTRKKELTTANLSLFAAKELEAIYGFNFTDQMAKTISSIDDTILTKYDKKQRRRQFKANLAKITDPTKSIYDISEALAESLKMASGYPPVFM